jgi:hypothetical protein
VIPNPEPPVVAGTILRTHGAPQVVVPACPTCGLAHRHMSTGLRVPACGAAYIVRITSDAKPVPKLAAA